MNNPKFKIDDAVNWVNGNGVNLGIRTVVGIDSITYGISGNGYYLNPIDTPWFAVKEEELTLVQ
jgi:hypothetical protein